MVRELEKSRNSLVQKEKISIWQTMAQQLAHEIKNPLTPIKLSAERIIRRFQTNPDRLGEILESSMLAIIQEVESLSNLLNEFRTLSRPIEPSASVTLLHDIIEETALPYKTSYPAMNFDINRVAKSVEVKMDRRHLSQVLTNLIINAIDAMNGEGTIEMRSETITRNEQRFCRFSIKDTGKGIRQEDEPKIFTPYFTTKSSGTGLGLPIIERIVTDYGGSIFFNTALGVGTTFIIDFVI
jgi:nitrogen fixation/metabolism regulation signal transduction histidine kinase